MNRGAGLVLPCSMVILAAACVGAPQPPESLRGAYLGQKPPGMEREIFGRGIVSTRALELNATFTPDGNELYFTRRFDDRSTLMLMRQVDGVWTEPEVAGFSGTYGDVDPFVTRNGHRLYFSSKRPLSDGSEEKDADLWYLEREEEGGWGPPVRLAELATDKDDYYTSVSDDGTLYFSIFASRGVGDIYRARSEEGGFGAAEPVGEVNTEASEHDPFVAPDGSYLIFTSDRPGGHGSGDLYISFATSDGSWAAPINMGESINSPAYEFCALLSQDGDYLFFTAENDIYWIDAKVIDGLRPASAPEER